MWIINTSITFQQVEGCSGKGRCYRDTSYIHKINCIKIIDTYNTSQSMYHIVLVIICNGGPSSVPRPKVLPEGRPILHSHNYTLTINNNYRTDHYCSRFLYYYKNQSSTMQINYKTMQNYYPNLFSLIASKRILMVYQFY